MAAPLTAFTVRRLRNCAALVLVSLLAWCLVSLYSISLHFTAITSGLVLLALLLALAFFNPRKKLPFLPLLRASSWLQFHIYAGWFAVILFLFHVGFRLPRGLLETSLAILFVIVALSGAAGIVISRTWPTLLTEHGENVLLERIPGMRTQLQGEVEALTWKSVKETGSFTISEFYARRLKPYFDRPRHVVYHLLDFADPLNRILLEVEGLDRYLTEAERKILAEITDRIRAKDNLDFQYAGQGLLKYWLFFHVPITMALLLLAFLHGTVALLYAGAIR